YRATNFRKHARIPVSMRGMTAPARRTPTNARGHSDILCSPSLPSTARKLNGRFREIGRTRRTTAKPDTTVRKAALTAATNPPSILKKHKDDSTRAKRVGHPSRCPLASLGYCKGLLRAGLGDHFKRRHVDSIVCWLFHQNPFDLHPVI